MKLRLADNIKEDPKSFYAYVQSKSKARVGIGPLKDDRGKVVDDVAEMTELLNNYFASVFTVENEGVPEAKDCNGNEEILENIEINEERVSQAIKIMKLNKAAGTDELPSTFVKRCDKSLFEPLVHIFRKSLDKGEIPEDWKNANVTAIFKLKMI